MTLLAMRARLDSGAREVSADVVRLLSIAWRDIVGIAALGLVVSGVWELAGPAWGRIALGAPLLAAYVRGEMSAKGRVR